MAVTLTERAAEGTAGEVLDRTLARLEGDELAVAILRDPARDRWGVLEVDLLVERSHRREVEALLVEEGFRRRPGWGRRPHRFFLRPMATGVAIDWLKLDVVTDLCFGPRHQWPTRLGSTCLGHRRPLPRPRLAPADELVAHVLHALADRGGLRAGDLAALARTAAEVEGGGPLARALTEPGRGPASFPGLLAAAREGQEEALQAAGPALRRRLARRHPVRGRGRGAANALLRRGAPLLRPLAGPGPVVALVGPDGTGKSTLAADLVEAAGVPCRALYGGTYRRGESAAVPGLATARVASRLLATRARMGWHRRMGRLVVLDRHPEQARPTPADGLARRARLRRAALAATLPRPDLLLVLDAPAQVLHSRRPEHPVDSLERDRARHRALRLPAPTHVVDATEAPEAVRARAVELIWRHAIPAGVPSPDARP